MVRLPPYLYAVLLKEKTLSKVKIPHVDISSIWSLQQLLACASLKIKIKSVLQYLETISFPIHKFIIMFSIIQKLLSNTICSWARSKLLLNITTIQKNQCPSARKMHISLFKSVLKTKSETGSYRASVTVKFRCLCISILN